MERFIQKDDIPDSLWSHDEMIMYLPPIVVDAWVSLLKKYELETLAQNKAEKGFIGGMSEEDTNKHLAWRYNGSSARIILSMLDPKNRLSIVSDTYAKLFSGNKVFVADLPCGSGAAIVSILSTLAELREKSCIPRVPITIVIVAGEISETARKYAAQQLSDIEEKLNKQAIWIDYEVVYWDVCDALSNTDLIKKLTIKSSDCSQRLLIISNFSGLLETNNKWKEAQPQFDELFRHSRDEKSTAIWIEPQKNNISSFFSKITKWFKQLFKSILSEKILCDTSDWYAQTDAEIKQPIKEGAFSARLSVIRFDLPLKVDK